MRLQISREAQRDLDEIWFNVATRSGSTEIADSVLDRVTSVFPLFGSHPESGREKPNLPKGIRSFPVDQFVIYYEAGKNSTVRIKRVLHGMKNQSKALRSK